MTTFIKKFIGKGKKNEKFEIIACSIDMEKAQDFITEYNGKKILQFEVALRKEKDKYGKSHSIYHLVRTDSEASAEQYEEQPEMAETDDLPY